MRYPAEWYQLEETIALHLPQLRPAQQHGLTWWVYGTILAASACQTAVVTALERLGSAATWRQYLREWLYDGADRAAPCQTQVAWDACFVRLVGWVLAWWRADTLTLAVDATTHRDQVVVVVVSVLYRGCAIPVAWHIQPASEPGAWMSPLLRLLRLLAPAEPPHLTVLVLADRGLWSPRLWKRLRDLGFHPLLRVQERITFQPQGGRRVPARTLVPGPGQAWVGAGVAFKHATTRQVGTLLVVWEADHDQPWLLLTDLAPLDVGVCWYGLRVWVELGFRALKGLGWHWDQTRRTDPARVARHWLVLAVAQLWTLAYGTRVEDADLVGVAPERLRTAPDLPVPTPRQRSVFRRGLARLQWQLARGRLWRGLWLRPDPLPAPPAELVITYHAPPAA